MTQVIFRSLLGALVALPVLVNALEVRGRVERAGDKVELISDQGVTWRLFPTTPSLTEDLLELNSGDYLEATLERPDKSSDFLLTQIHFVGVCRLIGLWLAADFSVVDIESFSELLLYERSQGPKKDPTRFSYILAPEEGPGWAILLSHPGEIMTGRLKFAGQNLNIKLWVKSVPRLDLHLTPIHRPSTRARHCL